MANIDALLRAAKRRHYPLGEHLPIFRHDPDYRPLGRAQPRPVMQKRLVVDGAPEHPMLGGAYRQHPFLPIYKPRRPRRS